MKNRPIERMNSILIYGSNHVSALEKIYLKHLIGFGYDVHLFPAQDLFLAYYNSSIGKKITFRLGLSSIYTSIDKKFREEIKAFKPQIVWVFKGMELLPETIIWLKEQGMKVINFNPDNPYIFSGRGSGNSNVTKSLHLFDLYLTYDSIVLAKLQQDKINAAFLPFGFDISEATFHKATLAGEVNRACFIGNPDEQRADFLKKLCQKKIPLDVYGEGWQKYISYPSLRIFPPVYEDEFWISLRKYRVQINMMRIHNLHSHNMRSFDVPGVGGIQVAPKTKDHSLFFEDGEEIFLYNDIEHCADIAEMLLSYSHADILKKREAARNACLEKKYTYLDRCSQALTLINNL